jgi:hypothetical protein
MMSFQSHVAGSPRLQEIQISWAWLHYFMVCTVSNNDVISYNRARDRVVYATVFLGTPEVSQNFSYTEHNTLMLHKAMYNGLNEFCYQTIGGQYIADCIENYQDIENCCSHWISFLIESVALLFTSKSTDSGQQSKYAEFCDRAVGAIVMLHPNTDCNHLIRQIRSSENMEDWKLRVTASLWALFGDVSAAYVLDDWVQCTIGKLEQCKEISSTLVRSSMCSVKTAGLIPVDPVPSGFNSTLGLRVDLLYSG